MKWPDWPIVALRRGEWYHWVLCDGEFWINGLPEIVAMGVNLGYYGA